MDINVKVIGRHAGSSNLSFPIHVTDVTNETVGALKEKIASRLKLRESGKNAAATIRLVFAGQFLSNDQAHISELELGPSTVLNALIADITNDNVDAADNGRKPNGDDDESRRQRSWRPRFFVYCKNYCGELSPGKLRVRCSVCRSTSVIVRREPNSWNDVLMRGSIYCECLENNGCSRSPTATTTPESTTNDGGSSSLESSTYPAAEFYFKCARCSNENGVVPLTQMKSASASQKHCSICCEADGGGDNAASAPPMVIFSCEIGHATCLNCFVSYSIDRLERRGFVMHPTHGYTLPCPEPRCRDGYILDPHHFRLIGVPELYEKYHRMAAEVYLLGEGGVYCPKPECSEAFITDSIAQANDDNASATNRKLIMCPKCRFTFCFYCRAGASECHCAQIVKSATTTHGDLRPQQAAPNVGTGSDEVKSYVTIHHTTKSCPNCRARTEKNEGCNHMVCVQCSFDWCWDCEKRWTEECQWNHWFD